MKLVICCRRPQVLQNLGAGSKTPLKGFDLEQLACWLVVPSWSDKIAGVSLIIRQRFEGDEFKQTFLLNIKLFSFTMPGENLFYISI